jgi:hypothetical protein
VRYPSQVRQPVERAQQIAAASTGLALRHAIANDLKILVVIGCECGLGFVEGIGI